MPVRNEEKELIALEGVWEISIKQNWEWIDALNAWS